MSAPIYRPPPPEAQPILYADADLIAVAKPSGLLSVPGRGLEKAACSQSFAQRHFDNVLVIHRLDMDTSGVLLFARNRDAQAAVSQQFQNRMVDKRYEAIVSGPTKESSGTVTAPIARFSKARPLRHIDPEGQEAITSWTVISHSAHKSRVALRPKTGRSHQLRLHMQTIGHPILGDSLYGNAHCANRLLLHSCSLEVAHPRTLNRIRFDVPVPF